jgi:trimeric autotransporter adhesin
MRNALRVIVVAVLAVVACAPGTTASAQSDILLQLRSGSPPGDRVRVDSAGGFIAMGEIGYGIIPATGKGWRMMWYPYKTAFRAGYADTNEFDDVNIGFYSWAGGALNRAAANYSFAMGYNNTVETGISGGTALGGNNKVWSPNGSYGMALGLSNEVVDLAGVAMGNDNYSNGDAAVAIGFKSTADADYSMAFGYRASTNGHTGAKVFADASVIDSLEAVANNEFAVRAIGGFRFKTSVSLVNGCVIAAGGTSFTCASTKTIKENFDPVDGENLLARIRAVPLNSWNVIVEDGKPRHIGPFAEDFHAAFGLGADSMGIGLQDIDGVNFGGVKALDARTTAMRETDEILTGTVAALRDEVESLKAQNAALLRSLQEVVERVKTLETPRPD